MNGRAVIVCSLIWLVSFAEGAKILAIMPLGGKSHDIIGAAFAKTLAGVGHDVTVITAYPVKNPAKNYRQIELTGMLEEAAKKDMNLFEFHGGFITTIMMLFFMYGGMPTMLYEAAMRHPNVDKLLKSNEKFDLVILESFLAEPFYGFAQHFDAQLITFSAFGNSWWTNRLVGAPAPPSHVAHFMLSYTDRMTFCERFVNTVFTLVDRAYYQWVYLPKQKHYYDLTFPNAKLTFEQQAQNVSLVFLNQHFALSSPRPYPPNMIEVGGIQIDEPKPLPKDLQKYLDEAPNGVIYFCMGSNIKTKHIPVEKREAFLKVFSKLKERVLWKFEDDSIPNQPANLMIKAWMPQNDILAHPNVKLFITHGGNLGTTESLYHGKPMIGIPIFGDQMMNIEKSVRAGYALLLKFSDISEATVSHAINTVLNDPTYARNAKLTSERFRDKPMTPQQTVVYWVEYVLRHGGSPQLRSPAMDLSYLQYHSLDVYAVMLLILGALSLVNLYIAKKLYRRIFKTKVTKSDKKKKA
ncbi:UDP-glucosyltransferase 2-like [Topomyia yanbarensis]|uniref:UDP-glucosyltransferase 2-like n=1 Tax=Topomyia yanbarensis TaxID=2498891 RepID=UPI00273BA009|nr:UDP-glucosyltransferase 2-like [Topomyia yanbarensis]